MRGAAVSQHATFVGGIVGGDDFNNLGTGANRGNAWAVRLVSGVNSEVMLNALIANRAQGATIHTNSWHDDTAGSGNPATYNQTAADADTFTFNNEDHLVLGSMGNNGEEQGPPGTAKNAVGVNAARRDPNEMNVGDGNPGPTADGRRKPDIVSPGCAITSSVSGTVCGVQTWPGNPNVCATSWATPATAAASALIRQYYREGWYPTGTARPVDALTPTGALLKATLLNATIDMTGVAGYPSNNEGWGLARLNNSLFFTGAPRRLSAWDVRHADGLATGEFQAFTVNVAASGEPLKVTLAWSDPPGTAGAANPIVNNLDLTVTAPDATTFRGNVFAGGQSTPGGAADTLNNVEQIADQHPGHRHLDDSRGRAGRQCRVSRPGLRRGRHRDVGGAGDPGPGWRQHDGHLCRQQRAGDAAGVQRRPGRSDRQCHQFLESAVFRSGPVGRISGDGRPRRLLPVHRRVRTHRRGPANRHPERRQQRPGNPGGGGDRQRCGYAARHPGDRLDFFRCRLRVDAG